MNLLKGEDRSFKALIAKKPWLLPSIFLIWGLGFILNNYSHGDEARQLSSVSESGVLNSAGIFVNEKAGFSITPPSGWHIGYGSKIDEKNKIKSFGEIIGREGRDLAMLVIASPDRSGRLMVTGRYI